MSTAQRFINQAGFSSDFTEETLQDYLIKYYRHIGYFVAKEVTCPTGRADIVIGHAHPQGMLQDASTGKKYNPVAVMEIKKWMGREEAIQAFGQGTAYSSFLGNVPIMIAGLLTTRDPEAARSVQRRFSLTGAKFFFVDETPEFYRSNWGTNPMSVLPRGEIPPLRVRQSLQVGEPAQRAGSPDVEYVEDVENRSANIDLNPVYEALRDAVGIALGGAINISKSAVKTAWRSATYKKRGYYCRGRVNWMPSSNWFRLNNLFTVGLVAYALFAVWAVITQPGQETSPIRQSTELVK